MAEIRRSGEDSYDVVGSLSFASVSKLLPAIETAGDARLVDLSEVSRTDSAGLALLLEWARQVRARGGALHLSGIPGPLRSLIRITGVGAAFELDASIDTVAAPRGDAVQ